MSGYRCPRGRSIRVGTLEIHPLFTPGHTDTHHAFLFHSPSGDWLFTGDALLIDACGRTDFQMGDAGMLYRSIHDKFFSCPNETLVYPAHDYEGRFVSTIGQQSPQPTPQGQPQRRGFREADERTGPTVPELRSISRFRPTNCAAVAPTTCHRGFRPCATCTIRVELAYQRNLFQS